MPVCYTQLVFVREGREDAFQRFEDHVLPLLSKYNGKLLYRARPSVADVIATDIGHPYEVHLISFGSQDDFRAYAPDEERQKYLHLKDESVESAMLIEGSLV